MTALLVSNAIWTVGVGAMMWAHFRERATLLQRIQAPQTAIIEHHGGESPRAVDLNDDNDFWISKIDGYNK